MPIRPENRDRYPATWPEISRRIRFARALGQCECAGECGTRHDGRCEARHNGAAPRSGAKVVLTVAHLDHTPENCDDANLRAFCQHCHLSYDAAEHKATAARTRAAAVAEWNDPLPGLEPAPAAVPAPRSNTTGALPNRGHFPADKDVLDSAALLHYKPPNPDDEINAASFVASRARALGWTREHHEEVLTILFAPPRPLMPHHKRNALANHADQEQP